MALWMYRRWCCSRPNQKITWYHNHILRCIWFHSLFKKVNISRLHWMNIVILRASYFHAWQNFSLKRVFLFYYVSFAEPRIRCTYCTFDELAKTARLCYSELRRLVILNVSSCSFPHCRKTTIKQALVRKRCGGEDVRVEWRFDLSTGLEKFASFSY